MPEAFKSIVRSGVSVAACRGAQRGCVVEYRDPLEAVGVAVVHIQDVACRVDHDVIDEPARERDDAGGRGQAACATRIVDYPDVLRRGKEVCPGIKAAIRRIEVDPAIEAAKAARDENGSTRRSDVAGRSACIVEHQDCTQVRHVQTVVRHVERNIEEGLIEHRVRPGDGPLDGDGAGGRVRVRARADRRGQGSD